MKAISFPAPQILVRALALTLSLCSAHAFEPGAFIEKYCADCHDNVEKKGNLDLTSLTVSLNDPANFDHWVKVHDRLQAGEMPPKKRKKRPEPIELEAFVKTLAADLTAHEQQIAATEGRATRRRLNASEYENILRDLFSAPWLQIRGQFPEDGEAHRFNKVGDALDISHVHMARYLAAADYAIRQILSVQLVRPETTTKRYYARDERGLTNFMPEIFNPGPERLKFPVLGFKSQPDVRTKTAPLTDPATREQEAVGWVHGNYVTGFGSSWRKFRAPVAGRYRLRFSGYTIWVGPGGRSYRFANENDHTGTPNPPEWFKPNADDISPGRGNEPITIYTRGGVFNRRIGEFDLTTEPAVHEIPEAWMLANESVVTDASRFFRSRPGAKWQNPLAQQDGQPGVAFRWMEVEGPLYDDSTTAGYRLLFGDLPLRKVDKGTRGVTLSIASQRDEPEPDRRAGERRPPFDDVTVEVVPTDPTHDAERLVRAFLRRAYRDPVEEADVQRFLALINERMKAGLSFTEGMVAGYTAIMASPGFVFLDEKPGRLDDYALATRLALFLWNSEPDEALRSHAMHGDLHRPDVLRKETERMLNDSKSRRFAEAFLDYWIDLRKIDDTTPSTTLYNDYYLDDALAEAALAETRLFFEELLQRDLPARNIIQSDFAFLNERLAKHYSVPGVQGIQMRQVKLPADSPRGGLMTQASILKITANGTTTSPVLRGKWIMERILGYEIPPPPSVPAVEPDIRGAVTIRQQLDKHRADPSCSVCHRKIDPPGFALESFDIMGGWRDQYRGVADEKAPEQGIGMNGHPFAFHYGLPVDCAGELSDGTPFKDIREFKCLLLRDEDGIARNLARQLIVYATGAAVRFSDRPDLEKVLQSAKSTGYGVRSLVHGIVQSELFLSK